jgi:hypothetical protein
MKRSSAATTAAASSVQGEAFGRFNAGEWTMPPKVPGQPPHGDFRAMPTRGDGLALLKWITSFPGNPRRGLPTVTGIVWLSDADRDATPTDETPMLLDELLDDAPDDLPVQVEAKAHGDPELARATAAAVCRVAGGRADRGRAEVLFFQASSAA